MAKVEIQTKAESLAQKMNKLTEKLELSEELIIDADDIVEFVEEKTQDVKLYEENSIPATEIIRLETLVQDFKFVRETLKENTENGRRVLNSVTLALLDSDDDKRASLIMSFAELNKSVADNMKLYIGSYKEISNVLLNLDKIKHQEDTNPKTVNNTLNINTTESINTVDLIKKLKGN